MSASLRQRAIPALIAMVLLAALLPVSTSAAVGPTSTIYVGTRKPVTSGIQIAGPAAGTPFVTIQFNLDGSPYHFLLAGPDGAPLAPGTYTDTRPQIEAGQPLLDWYPECDGFGSFVVHEIVTDAGGTPTTLAADLTLNCRPAVYAAIRIGSTWPVAAVWVSPSNVQIGAVTIGETAASPVTVRSVGNTPVTLRGAVTEGLAPLAPVAWSVQFDTCGRKPMAPGTSCELKLIYRPTANDEQWATLSVMTDGFARETMAAYMEGVARTATTTWIETIPSPVIAGQAFQIVATESPPTEGVFELYLDGVIVTYAQASSGRYVFGMEGLTVGAHTLRVDFIPPTWYGHLGSTRSLPIRVVHETTTAMMVSDHTPYENAPPTVTATVSGPSGLTGGTLSIKDETTGKTLGSLGVTTTKRTLTIKPDLAVGVHKLRASYSGTTTYGPSQGADKLTVLADDSVALTKVTLTPGTFYPYKDSYLDTATIGGVLDEPAKVVIRIYNASGTRVYLKDLSTRNGTYTQAWNGRSSAGTMLAAGTYRVEQTFADLTGHTKKTTQSVTLSSKRLVTKTVYVSKKGSAATATEGRVTISSTGGYAKLTADYPALTAVGYQFSIPAATVYKSITFQVYAKGPLSAPPNQLAMQNFVSCPLTSGDWSADCFDRWTGFGSASSSAKWYSASGHVTRNRSGRTVRGLAIANVGTVYIYKARVKVVYGVLQ